MKRKGNVCSFLRNYILVCEYFEKISTKTKNNHILSISLFVCLSKPSSQQRVLVLQEIIIIAIENFEHLLWDLIQSDCTFNLIRCCSINEILIPIE